MTYAEIESKVRTLVNDTESPYRFETADINGYAVDAVRHLRNINPSERYGESGLLDDEIPSADEEGADIRIDPRHEEAVVKYVAHRVYEQDMTDTVNAQISETLRVRAEALMQL